MSKDYDGTPKTHKKYASLYFYVTWLKNMLQIPLIYTRGRLGAGAGAYLKFEGPSTLELTLDFIQKPQFWAAVLIINWLGVDVFADIRTELTYVKVHVIQK